MDDRLLGTVVGVDLSRTMLVGRGAGSEESRSTLSKRHVLRVVGRRSLPSILEASIVPAVLFYGFFVTIGAVAAMIAALAWSYGALLRRWLSGHPVPGLLQLAIAGLTVRTIVGIVSGTFMYFIQPVATTLVLSLVFAGSLFVGRPLIARMASDFCPLAHDVASRPAVVKLFSGLTLLWAGVHLLSAGMTFMMLMSLATPTFVLLKTLVSLAITASAVVLTVSWALRVARSEQLAFAQVPV
jgi:hypothetical protein